MTFNEHLDKWEVRTLTCHETISCIIVVVTKE